MLRKIEDLFKCFPVDLCVPLSAGCDIAPDAGDEQSAASQNPEREPVAEKAKAITKHATAGRVYGHSDVVRQETEDLRTSKSPFAPFSNRIDWEIAKWTKDSQTGDNKLETY